MKFARNFTRGVVCGVVLMLAASSQAQSTEPTQGHITIVRIQGSAQYSLGDNLWHPLAIGQTFGAGAVIQSGANSTVDITLSDKVAPKHIPLPGQMRPLPVGLGLTLAPFSAMAQQDVIQLGSDSELAIDKLLSSTMGVEVVKDTELDLRKGHILGNVKKVSAASVFLVKMPNGVAGIRGTMFAIGDDGVLTVFQGSVVVSVNIVSTTGGVTTTTTVAEVVTAGQQFNPANVVPAGTTPTGGNTVTTSTTTSGPTASTANGITSGGTTTTTGTTTTSTTGTSTGTTTGTTTTTGTGTTTTSTGTTVSTGVTTLTPAQQAIAFVQALTGQVVQAVTTGGGSSSSSSSGSSSSSSSTTTGGTSTTGGTTTQEAPPTLVITFDPVTITTTVNNNTTSSSPH